MGGYEDVERISR